MTKREFMTAVRERISALPEEEQQKSLRYYSEMIDDRVEDGMEEETAVSAMGAPEEVAREIMLAAPLPTLVKSRMKPSRALRAWEIVLIVLGSPVWLPILLTVVVLFLTVYLVIWTMIISLYAVDIALFGSGIGCLIGLPLLHGLPVRVLSVGAGLFLIGFSLACFLLVNRLSVLLIRLSGKFLRYIKSLFVKKERQS